RSDPSYQRYQELEKQLETTNQKVAETKAVAAKAREDAAGAKGVVVKIRVAQAHAVVFQARETLAAKQQQHEKLLAAVAAADEDNAKAVKDLGQAKTALAAQPAKIKAFQADAQKASKAADLARAALKEAGRMAAKHPEAETTPK